MFPIDIDEFKARFPILYAHFEFQTFKEFERANINLIMDDAKACDYEATAKVIYYDNQFIRESWVSEKIFRLSHIMEREKELKIAEAMEEEEMKKLRREIADAKHHLHKIGSAIKRTYPVAGAPHKNIFRMEDELLTEEYIRTVIEIQKVSKEIDCKKKYKAKLFTEDSKFWQAVREMKIRMEEKTHGKKLSESEIKRYAKTAEGMLINEICNESATVVARSILAEEYGVEENTMERRFRGFSEVLQERPKIDTDDESIRSLIQVRKEMRRKGKRAE